MRTLRRIEVIDGVHHEIEGRTATPEEENHADSIDLAAAFVANPNPTPAQVKYAVRWLVAREMGLPAPPIPSDVPIPIR